MDLWAHQTITDNRDVLLSAFATASYLKEIYVCTRTEHRSKKFVAEEHCYPIGGIESFL